MISLSGIEVCLHIVYVVPFNSCHPEICMATLDEVGTTPPGMLVIFQHDPYTYTYVVPAVFICRLLMYRKMGVAIFCLKCWSEPCVWP